MSGEEVTEVKTEEATEPVANEIIEEEPKEEPKGEPKEEAKEDHIKTEVVEEAKPKAKAKATPKKLARSVKVVELVACDDCGKRMLPKSLRNTHPYYCKGQPTETLPVNRQKASYGSKVGQKLRKEIEAEMEVKYNKPKETEQYSEPIEVKTKAKPSVPSVRSVPRQLTARELLEASYNEIRRAKREEHKINSFKSKML